MGVTERGRNATPRVREMRYALRKLDVPIRISVVVSRLRGLVYLDAYIHRSDDPVRLHPSSALTADAWGNRGRTARPSVHLFWPGSP